MKKRVRSLVVALVLCLGLLPTSAFAAESDFVIENSVLTKYNGPGGDLVIPDGVTEIGGQVFAGRTDLTSVTFPDSVIRIGSVSFSGCTGIKSLVIPDSVTSLGPTAFAGCDSLEELTLSPNIEIIPLGSFGSCGSLKSIVIPYGVHTIEGAAFGSCDGLERVVIPDSVTKIERGAFGGCDKLKDVVLPKNIPDIELGAFQSCASLTDLILTPGADSVGGFLEWDSLTEAVIPDGVKTIENSAFLDCKNLKRVHIPASVTSIDNFAFGGCSSLSDVYYGGSKEQWDRIKISNVELYDGWTLALRGDNTPLTSAVIHYNSASPDSQFSTPTITVENIPAKGTAIASTQVVTVDGKKIEFQMYALKDANGNLTNYIKLRDMAYVLNGTKAQFAVGYDGTISLTTGQPYQAGGTEMKTPFSGSRAYTGGAQTVKVNGANVAMTAITLTDDAGGAYNYFKLRDLGKVLDFYVGYSNETGIYIDSTKPYSE